MNNNPNERAVSSDFRNNYGVTYMCIGRPIFCRK
nr:MAG TPA: hypothetical protein [Caudoviricetes sp.]